MIIQEIEKGKANLLYKKSKEALEQNLNDEMFAYLEEAIKLRDDRDTPDFKNYIKYKVQVYHLYKEQFKKICKEKNKKKESSLEKSYYSQRLTTDEFKKECGLSSFGIYEQKNGGFYLWDGHSRKADGTVAVLGKVHRKITDIEEIKNPVMGLTIKGDWILYNQDDGVDAFIDTLLLKSDELELTVTKINNENTSLCKTVDEKERFVDQLKKEKSLSSEKINILYVNNSSLRNNISLLNGELRGKDVIIRELNDKIILTDRLLNQKINSLKQEKLKIQHLLSNTQKELDRVRAITWWQKLWGKK